MTNLECGMTNGGHLGRFHASPFENSRRILICRLHFQKHRFPPRLQPELLLHGSGPSRKTQRQQGRQNRDP